MSSTYRASLLIVCVGLLAAFTCFQTARAVPDPAETPKPPVPTPDASPDKPPVDPAATSPFGEALTLPSDRTLKKKLEAAIDYLKAESWGDAVRLLQTVIESRDDVFIPLRGKGSDGKPTVSWRSARAEALRLFATLPPPALEFYELNYGVVARARLDEARQHNDMLQLDEVARRYCYTRAGLEATTLLATYHLDRGRPGTAAALFERLLQRQSPDQIEPLTLFKAVLAFQQSGDDVHKRQAWDELVNRVGSNGLRLNATVRLTLAQMRDEIERQPRGGGESGDWPLFRGDVQRTARASGDVPYLEPTWQRSSVEEAASQHWLAAAVKNQDDNQQPVLPGAFPLVVGGKVLYRSYRGVVALDARTGKHLWSSPMHFDLDQCMNNRLDAGKKVQVEQWIRLYTAGPGGQGALGGGAVPGAFIGVPPGGPGIPVPSPAETPASGPVEAPSLLFENSVLGTLSSDGHLVYAIEDLCLPPPPWLFQPAQEGMPPPPLGPFKDPVSFSKLVAVDVETGKAIWTIGGHGKDVELADSYFLGPPLPVAGKLYVLVEKQGEITLVCLDPGRGVVAWQQPLVVVREKILTDVRRRVEAAHLAYADGLLVCPTNAGAVLGVDLLSRSLVWAHAYREKPPETTPEGAAPPADPMETAPDPLHPTWRSSAPIIQEGKVYFTAPDSDSVRCLDLHEGNLVWKLPRSEDDLYLAGVYRNKVVIVGKNTCRAVSATDGKTESWKVLTGMPSGEGTVGGDRYYLPLRTGAVCILDLDKGQILARGRARRSLGASPQPAAPPPGNLLFHHGDLLSQSVFGITAYPQIRTRFAEVDAQVARNPRDPVPLTERGELKLYQGDLAGAIVDLHTALPLTPPADLPAAQRTLYDAITQLLERDFPAGEKYLEECRQLCRVPVPDNATPQQRHQCETEQLWRHTNLLCMVAQGREHQPGRLADAVQAYVDIFNHDSGGLFLPLPQDPVVQARPEVWARSRLASLFAHATGDDLRLLQEVADRQWQQLRTSADTAAVERFVDPFGNNGEVGKEARLRLAELLLEDRGWAIEAEQVLLGLQHDGDRSVAARATDTLARLLARKGLLEDAFAQYSTLSRDFGRIVVRDGKTGNDIWEELTTDKRFLPYLHPVEMTWQTRKHHVQKRQVATPAPQVILFDPQGDVPPSLRRQELVLDLLSSTFKRVDRQTGNTAWSQHVVLDGLRSHLLQNGVLGTRVGCPCHGHLAVVGLGSVVFGLDLLDGRVLWKRPLVDGPFQQERMVVEVQDSGLGQGMLLQLMGVDRTGQGQQKMLARLGPVGPGYVTVQTTTGLAALDPLRGEVLWSRRDVAVDSDNFGDDTYLYLLEKGGMSGRALHARDGAVAEEVPEFATAINGKQQVVLGRHLLLTAPEDNKIAFSLYDLHTGKTEWKLTAPADALVMQSTVPYLAGFVSRDGEVHIGDFRVCREVLRSKIEPRELDKVQQVSLFQDRHSFYLALQRPVDPSVPIHPLPHSVEPKEGMLQGDPWTCVGSLETVPVNGRLYAFDRTTGKFQWDNRVLNQQVVLEQTEELPIVLLAAGLNWQISGNVGQTIRVGAIDKATGKWLSEEALETNTFQALHVDPVRKIIDLIGPNVTVRFDQEGAGQAPPKRRGP